MKKSLKKLGLAGMLFGATALGIGGGALRFYGTGKGKKREKKIRSW
jgi:hypothetical protein